MDKYEYKIRAEEIRTLIAEGDYFAAAQIADTIDWTRVRKAGTLCTISDLYKKVRRFDDAIELLQLAYERYPEGKDIRYYLCELYIRTDDIIRAKSAYNDFVRVASKDPRRYILQYKLCEMQNVNLEERIEVLEEYKKRDYREKWAYELAYLYHRVGLASRCVEECDELFLMFGRGKYVTKALELKMLHAPLSPAQQRYYDTRDDAQQEVPQIVTENGEVYSGVDGDTTMIYTGASAPAGESPESPSDLPVVTKEDEARALALGETRIFESVQEGVQIAETGQKAQISVRPGEELDIQVRQVDVSEYSTINLQRAIAEGVQEALGTGEENAESAKMAVTRSILAPMMYDTDTEDLEEPDLEEISEDDIDTGNIDVAQATRQEPETGQESGSKIEQNPEQETRQKPGAEKEPTQESSGRSGFASEHPKDALDEDPHKNDVLTYTEVFFGETGEISEEEMAQALPERRIERDENARTVYYPEGKAPSKADVSAMIQTGEIPATEQSAGVVLPESVRRELEAEERRLREEEERPSAEKLIEKRAVLDQTVYGGSAVDEKAAEAKTAQPPETIARVMTQEADGQLGFVVPESHSVTKQITGQMSLTDVMTEWERMKRENEERNREQLYQRVKKQTGELFNKFEAELLNTKLEEIEREADAELAARAQMGESSYGEKEGSPEAYPERFAAYEPEEGSAGEYGEIEALAEMDESADVEWIEAVDTGATEETGTNLTEVSEDLEPGSLAEEALESGAEKEGVEESVDSSMSSEQMPEQETLEEAFGGAAEPLESDRQSAVMETEPEAEVADIEELEHYASGPARELTKEEKELFGPYIQSKSARRQLVHVLDNIRMEADTGNVLLSGDDGTNLRTLAEQILKNVRRSDKNFSGKVAKISAKNLAAKNVEGTLSQLANGGLIIENASELSADAADSLCENLERGKLGIVVVITDKQRNILKFREQHSALCRLFTARMHVKALSDKKLVSFAKQYAKEKEYAINDMGILALSTKIDSRQTNDHAVDVVEVKEMVDDAIRHVRKKTPSHFFDVLLGKRYDEEDMIILGERDFA